MTRQTHLCHWPGCREVVPPKLWGCRAHWFTLPAALRSRIWSTYRPGQEVTKTPSAEYVAAAKAVQEWIKTRQPIPPAAPAAPAFHEPKEEP